MFDVTFPLSIASFVAGLLMFIAPCTLPLLPAYIAFIGGVQERTIVEHVSKRVRLKLLKNAIAFVVGFSCIFIASGFLLGFVGSHLGTLRVQLSQIGGIIVILFGVLMFAPTHIGWLSKTLRIPVPKSITPGNPRSSFFIGTLFALGWTPCIGPVLATVLLFASTSTSALYGAYLLTLFSIGFAIPFIATALLFSTLSKWIGEHTNISLWFNRISGVLLILLGVLLLTASSGLLTSYGIIFFEYIGLGTLFTYL